MFCKKFCPRQRSCPGQVVSSKKSFPGQVLPQAAKLPGTSGSFKKKHFLENDLSQAAKLPGTSGFFQKNDFLEEVLPQAAKLPGTSGLFIKKRRFLRKSSAPGSEAARDKWLVKKKSDFRRKVLPRAAKLPRTSGLFKKNRISGKKFCPGQVVRSRESEQPLRPRARSAFWGVRGAQSPAFPWRPLCYVSGRRRYNSTSSRTVFKAGWGLSRFESKNEPRFCGRRGRIRCF